MKLLHNMRKSHILRYVLYLIPGAVILFFGMVALHSTLMLIDSQRNFSEKITIYAEDAFELQSAYYDFLLDFHQYRAGGEAISQTAVIDKFAVFYDKNQEFMDGVTPLKGNPELVTYLNRLEELQKKIKALTPQIVDLRAVDQAHPDHDLYHKIEQGSHNILMELKMLQKQSQSILNGISISSDMKEREIYLYWSVIAIGLCGFILVLLNADKLRQLKIKNEEKISYLDLLESRLAALEAAHDGIIIIDANGNVSFINKAMCRMLDTENTEHNNGSFGQWKTLFADDEVEILEEDILPEIEEKGYWIGELPLYHGNGSVVYTDFSITKVADGGMIVTAMDVSEKHRAESEKRQFEEQFYQAQKMEAIGRLAGGIAHDFNNILAAINGYAEFLTDDLDPNSEQHKFAQNIIQAGRQAKDLVDQILAFSRRKDSARTTMDFLEPVQEATSMILATFPKTLELKTEINVSQAAITGNANQISQVLMNLCVNARDAMDDDRGVLSICVEHYKADKDFCIPEAVQNELPDPKGVPFLLIQDVNAARTRLIVGHLKSNQDYVKLTIQDSGSGMPRIVMEHVFEPFFTTKPVDKGTGLGLATVHGVVIGHSGALIIDSTIGQGTRFDLYFPASAVGTAAVQEKISASQQETDTLNLRILLVEDQKYVLDMMQNMLARAGHTVSTARDGVEALYYIKEHGAEIDLVITDQNMPKMTGIEMIEQIHIDWPDLDFLVVSGYSEKQMLDLIESHPAIKGVLRKPVSNIEIHEKIATIISQRRAPKVQKLAS